MRPGDVIVTRSDRPVGLTIQAVTRSPWNHVRWVVDGSGRVLEANPSGAEWGEARRGDVLIEVPLSDEQRSHVPDVAEGMHGTPYGFLDDVALGLAEWGVTLPVVRRRVERPDRLFCSQLADLGLCRVGFHVFTDGRTHQAVTPGAFAVRALRAGWRTHEI